MIIKLLLIASLSVLVLAAACGDGETEAVAHFEAGAALQETGQLEEAIAEYDEAIRLNPKDAFAYSNRGKAYNDLGQYQRAIQDYDEAIPSRPATCPGLHRPGRCLRCFGTVPESH